MFKSIYTTVILKIQIFLGKSSGWILDLVIDHTVSISKYNPLAGGNYMKLSKRIERPSKELIKIQNIDDKESFKVACVVDIRLFFMDLFCYNLIVLIK